MPLAYADPHLPPAKPRRRWDGWAGVVLTLVFVVSAALCFRAMRWDRWAKYESNDRRWWKNLPGESYASYKAWYAWRKSWERAAAAVGISGMGVIVAGGWLGVSWWRGKAWSRWLMVAIVLHGLVAVYSVVRWGPDFRHPYHSWTG